MLISVRGNIRKKCSTTGTTGTTITKLPIALLRGLGALFRHPFFLLVCGFGFSTFLGSYITHSLDQQQRDRESVTKSFDALRSASDDLLVAFAEFQVRALHLRDQIVANGPAMQRASTDYEAAYIRWIQRAAADGAVIEQMYENTSVSHTVLNYLSAFEFASGVVDTCMRSYIASPQRWTDVKNTDVACDVGAPLGRVAMNQEMVELGFCVRIYALAVRPTPTLDFLPPVLRDQLLHRAFDLASTKCSVDSRLMLHTTGLTPAQSRT